MAQSFQVSLPAQAQGVDVAAEQEEIARRRRMADMLRQQSAQPEGQMVSGRFVAPSLTQRLAGLFNAYQSGQIDRQASEQARSLGRSVREQEDQGNARIVAAATGPGRSMVQTAGPDVPDFMRPTTQPVAPDPAERRNNMISAMMSHPNPAVRAQALSLATQPAQQPQWKVETRYNEQTGRPERVLFNPANPAQTMPFGGQQAQRLEFRNMGGTDQAFDPFTGQPVGAPIDRTMTPGESKRLDFDQFQFQNLSPFQRGQLRISAANANVAAGQLANAQTNTFFTTGMVPPGGGGVRLNLPPNAPMPAAGGPVPQGVPQVQPPMQAPQGAPQVPAQARPSAAAPSVQPGQLPRPGVIGQPPAQVPGPAPAAAGLTPKQQAEAAAEDAKRRDAAVRGFSDRRAQIVNTVGSIDRALGQVGENTAGFGTWLSILPRTQARDLRATLSTVKASLAFDELKKMRESSPTGGALGSVTERELDLLESAVQSLDQGQSPQQLRANLERVRTHYTNWANAVAQSAGMPAINLDRPGTVVGEIQRGGGGAWEIVR
jgi:hypothetical protein